MPIEGITATEDIGIYVDEEGVAQIRETPGGRGQSAEVEVTYVCRAKDRFAVYTNLLGGGFAQLNGLGVPIPGHAYPPSPNLSCDQIGSVQLMGINRDFLLANFDDAPARRWNWNKWCLIPAIYRPLDYAFDASSGTGPAAEVTQIDPNEPIIGARQRIDVNNSFIIIDEAKMQLMLPRASANDPLVPRDPPEIRNSTDGIPASSVSFTLEYPRVPRNPWRHLRRYVGRVNAHKMWDMPPEHILFASVVTDIQWTFRGPEVSCVLTYIGNLDMSWNEMLHIDGSAVPKAFVVATGEGEEKTFRVPFRSADLMQPLRG